MFAVVDRPSPSELPHPPLEVPLLPGGTRADFMEYMGPVTPRVLLAQTESVGRSGELACGQRAVVPNLPMAEGHDMKDGSQHTLLALIGSRSANYGLVSTSEGDVYVSLCSNEWPSDHPGHVPRAVRLTRDGLNKGPLEVMNDTGRTLFRVVSGPHGLTIINCSQERLRIGAAGDDSAEQQAAEAAKGRTSLLSLALGGVKRVITAGRVSRPQSTHSRNTTLTDGVNRWMARLGRSRMDAKIIGRRAAY